MYDTVNLWKDRTEGECYSQIIQHIQNVKEIADVETGKVYYAGRLDNLNVFVSTVGISIKGSLAKFYFPDNTYMLNKHNVKDAILKLSDQLHVNIAKALITGLDVSANFIMNYKPEQYFKTLGFCQGFKRVEVADGSLYYNSKCKGVEPKKLCFYNKVREVEYRTGIMPDVYIGTNLLRYEHRWRSRLTQQLKETEIIGATLYDERFYCKIIDLWAEAYFSIDKKQVIKIDAMNEIKTVSDAFNVLVAHLISQTDQTQITAFFEELKEAKVFDKPKYYSMLKAKIKEVSSKNRFTTKDELVKELDSEIRNIQSYIK